MDPRTSRTHHSMKPEAKQNTQSWSKSKLMQNIWANDNNKRTNAARQREKSRENRLIYLTNTHKHMQTYTKSTCCISHTNYHMYRKRRNESERERKEDGKNDHGPCSFSWMLCYSQYKFTHHVWMNEWVSDQRQQYHCLADVIRYVESFGKRIRATETERYLCRDERGRAKRTNEKKGDNKC